MRVTVPIIPFYYITRARVMHEKWKIFYVTQFAKPLDKVW